MRHAGASYEPILNRTLPFTFKEILIHVIEQVNWLCVYMHWEQGLKRERGVCFSMLTLYKLDSGTSGTLQQKACFEETSVQASFTLSTFLSQDIQRPSVCRH